MDQTQKTSTRSEAMHAVAGELNATPFYSICPVSSLVAVLNPKSSSTLEAKSCRLPPLPFLNAIARLPRPVRHRHSFCLPHYSIFLYVCMVHARAQQSSIDVSGCTACPLLKKMGTTRHILLLAGALVVSALLAAAVAAAEYVRPPPRPIILTEHTEPATHPQQVHVSAVGARHMRVSWITDDKHAPSVVEYGSVSRNYTASAAGDHTSYRYFLYSSGKIHHVKIGPLEPGTVYCYRCGMAGKEFSLRTPPAALPIELALVGTRSYRGLLSACSLATFDPSDRTAEENRIAAGDLGQTEWTASTLAHVSKTDHDMVLVPGDLSYADTQQPLWDTFGRFVQRHASRRPWMVTQGNHEVEAAAPVVPGSPPPFAAYAARWRMPHEDSASPSNLYYSFDAAGGAVHVVMLGSYAMTHFHHCFLDPPLPSTLSHADLLTDTCSIRTVEQTTAHAARLPCLPLEVSTLTAALCACVLHASSDQYRWLARDLAAVDRRATPWLVVLLHAPWYNTNAAHQGEGEAMREALERLLFQARVDVVFAGHVHAYERFVSSFLIDPCRFSFFGRPILTLLSQTRVYDNEANPCGPVYITIGDGGNREGLALDFEKNHKLAPLSVKREASFGHGRLRVVNATAAHWAWHRNDDADSVVRDELWLESLAANASCWQHGDSGAVGSRDDEL
ncbi:hypothetical protein U9M48_032448 [Paspalum notatum var. saurae]|uniref:Purple acid phosphatase n=1 Tax=Paspalum notatum var. saurae TaxID=547442 RepID=A0AAQ3U541_PASNO